MTRTLGIIGIALLSLPEARSQSIVSLRAGLLSYGEGRIETTSGARPKAGAFHLPENEQLRTIRGRAEILLAPTVFLRVADNSCVEMMDATVGQAEVRVHSGTVIVDAVDFGRDAYVKIHFGAATAEIRKAGIYRFEGEPAEARTYDGRLDVIANGRTIQLKKGKRWIDGATTVTDFDRKETDRIQRWSARRSIVVAQSNLKLARSTYGRSWRRAARIWIWSVLLNAEAAKAKTSLLPSR